jgi:hypothetical protein
VEESGSSLLVICLREGAGKRQGQGVYVRLRRRWQQACADTYFSIFTKSGRHPARNSSTPANTTTATLYLCIPDKKKTAARASERRMRLELLSGLRGKTAHLPSSETPGQHCCATMSAALTHFPVAVIPQGCCCGCATWENKPRSSCFSAAIIEAAFLFYRSQRLWAVVGAPAGCLLRLDGMVGPQQRRQ